MPISWEPTAPSSPQKTRRDSMSALGQKRTLTSAWAMSALPPKADIGGVSSDVRFVPKADIACAPYRQLDVPINELCRARPMRAQSREWCRHFLSGDWHVCGHATRHVGPQKETCSNPAPVPDRQEMGSSNRQSS